MTSNDVILVFAVLLILTLFVLTVLVIAHMTASYRARRGKR